jgi:hypothetical protein
LTSMHPLASQKTVPTILLGEDTVLALFLS